MSKEMLTTDDLNFIPLANKRFDLIIPSEYCSTEATRALLESLDSDEFRAHVTHMGGHETFETGKIVYERE